MIRASFRTSQTWLPVRTAIITCSSLTAPGASGAPARSSEQS